MCESFFTARLDTQTHTQLDVITTVVLNNYGSHHDPALLFCFFKCQGFYCKRSPSALLFLLRTLIAFHLI